MNVTLHFRRSSNPRYDWAVYADSEHIGFAWQVPGFRDGKRIMWKATDLTGTFQSEAHARRVYAADALLKDLESRDAVESPQVSIHTLKHNLSLLATKLSNLMIAEDLTADEVAKVRIKLEEASHALEIALAAQF